MSVETFGPRDGGQAMMIQHGLTASHSMYGAWFATAPRFAKLGLDMSRELALAKTRDAICNVRYAGGHDLSTCRGQARWANAQKSMGRIDTPKYICNVPAYCTYVR